MADENKGPQLQLSGYQPSREASGLGVMATRIYDAFMEALRVNDQSGETLRFPVVGVLEGRVGHIGRPGSDKEPSIELRFIAIEPVLDRDTVRAAPWSARAQDLSGQLYASVDDDAKKKLDELFEELESATPTKTVLGLMHQLRDVRLGEPTLFDGDGADLPPRAPNVNDPLSFPDVGAYIHAYGEFVAHNVGGMQLNEKELKEARDRYFEAVKVASEEELAERTTEVASTGGEATNGKAARQGRAKATVSGGKVLTAQFSAE